jgi:hypothetical protein
MERGLTRPADGNTRSRTISDGRQKPRALALILSLTVLQPACTSPDREAIPTTGQDSAFPDPASVPAWTGAVPAQAADELLGTGWSSSDDFAWTTRGDAEAFHLLVAAEKEGYAWRTVASLNEPGLDADLWIGNVCLTESGRKAIVVYAPRSFTNREALSGRGAFTAVVDIATGAVTKLPVRSSLAYFNPGCGAGERAVLTQERGDDPTSSGFATRLFVVEAESGQVTGPTELRGQVTSAVPAGGFVVAASGTKLVAIGAAGAIRELATTDSVPFRLAIDGEGGLVFMEHGRGIGHIRRLASLDGHEKIASLAQGALSEITVARGTHGRVFVAGPADLRGTLPTGVRHLAVPSTAEVSTQGHLAILHEARPPEDSRHESKDGLTSPSGGEPQPASSTSRFRDAEPAPSATETGVPATSRLLARVLATRKEIGFLVAPGIRPAARLGEGMQPYPAPATVPSSSLRATTAAQALGPVDEDAFCAIPRNDSRSQVYQPTPRQVEWAADQAVVGNLRTTRPTNWKQSGLSAWSPQGLFPPLALEGGGRVPVQILLGILAQESNLWQASGHVLSGEFGNPLIGNFYGIHGGSADSWEIQWNESDCGYGIAQVTDGMRKAGHERPFETSLPPTLQRAVALDYATNIAAGLRILQAKWNETRAAGLVYNDGDPQWIENWFLAVWAYNSGLHPDLRDGSPWGLGWANNPVNPRYPANRAFFNVDPHDASHPQDWPYQEKVIGWAAYSIATPDGIGFRPAWWVNATARDLAKPPVDLFCDESNDCDPAGRFVPNAPEVEGEPGGPCGHQNDVGQYDLKCWWHESAQFRSCAGGYCGHELLRFNTTYPEQPDGTHYPPSCSIAGLPAGALVIDDVPSSVSAPRAGCAAVPNSGSFTLTFGSGSLGTSPARIDLHQIGGGFGGHFWFAHTRGPDATGRKMRVTGAWTLDRPVEGWARVLVHMPDHGAQTQQARYEIDLGNGTTQSRYAIQRTEQNRWVSLGVMEFAGIPKIALTSETHDGVGRDDIAWDAVAIQPLQAKPTHFIVSLGDSYSSGEGASEANGDDYFSDSNRNGRLKAREGRNACHRSRYSWSRQAILADNPSLKIGQRVDIWDSTLDYQFHACSGAVTANILPDTNGTFANGQYSEVGQIDKGYLDENTTLVTLSIGGNDAGFAGILQACILNLGSCMLDTLPGETEPMLDSVPRRIKNVVDPAIRAVLRAIHKKAPNAKIILMGYPTLFPDDGSCTNAEGSFTQRIVQLGFSDSEEMFINYLSFEMASMMSNATDAAYYEESIPVWFADPESDFAGHRICGEEPEIHNFVFTLTEGEDTTGIAVIDHSPVSQQSFHPTLGGALLYSNTLIRVLRSIGM